MFSGLIAATGVVKRALPDPTGGLRLEVRCEDAHREAVQPKDSVAIDGVCLTAVTVAGDIVAFDVVPETLVRSTLGALREGDAVNVEYALRIGDRLGGHFVYGHVDAAATVLTNVPEGQGRRMRIALPKTLHRFVRDKAFVAVDGVSVTVAGCGEDWFDVALVPETLARTTLGRRNGGDRVNLEVDPIARYAAQQP